MIIESAAAVVAIVFGIKFLIGRRVIVEKRTELTELGPREVIRFTGVGGKQYSVSKELAVELADSAQRVEAANQGEGGSAILAVIRIEKERILRMCQRRFLAQDRLALEEFIKLLQTKTGARLAIDELRNVGHTLRERAADRERDSERKSRHYEAEKKDWDRQEEIKKPLAEAELNAAHAAANRAKADRIRSEQELDAARNPPPPPPAPEPPRRPKDAFELEMEIHDQYQARRKEIERREMTREERDRAIERLDAWKRKELNRRHE